MRLLHNFLYKAFVVRLDVRSSFKSHPGASLLFEETTWMEFDVIALVLRAHFNYLIIACSYELRHSYYKQQLTFGGRHR